LGGSVAHFGDGPTLGWKGAPVDKHLDKKADRILEALGRLFPKAEMHRILDDLAGRRMPFHAFRTFVWHTMAKAATEKVEGRRWELIEGDLRHKATELAVIYAMHCVYERAARGRPDLSFGWRESELWTWVSKAG
jgi:hypothetical protein